MPRGTDGSSAPARPSTGPLTAGVATATAGWRQIIKSTAGAIGYVDYADAKASGLVFASIKNQAGKYVAPSVPAASAAASKASIKPDLTFSAIWAPGATSYPITAQSWVLVYQKQSSTNTTKMLKAWVGYLIGDGQKLLPNSGFRAAALQHRPAGQGADQQDRLVNIVNAPGPDRLASVSTVTQEDQAVPADRAR